MRMLELGRMGTCVMLLGSLCFAVACGSSDSGEFTPGADNDEDCPASEADFQDGATIPADADCSYTNLVASGNIAVEPGGNLTLEDAEVTGNIQAGDGGAVTLRRGTIGGNLQVSEGASVELVDMLVEGDLQISGASEAVSITDTAIVGNMQISDCTGETVELESLTVGGNLECTGNDATFAFSDVSVDGTASGQCEEAAQ